MDSAVNLEAPESIVGLPLTNVPSSNTSADAPLLGLLGTQFHEMSVEQATLLVAELRALRKNPQKLSSKLVEGTETKRPRKAATATKAAGKNMANQYLLAFAKKDSSASDATKE